MPELIFPLTYFWGQYQPGDSRPFCCVQWGKVSQSRGLTKRPPPTHTHFSSLSSILTAVNIHRSAVSLHSPQNHSTTVFY